MNNDEIADKIEQNIGKVLSINPSHDKDLLKKGLSYAWKAHEDQTRLTKEPYILHTIAVSEYLAKEFDTVKVVGGYLHDVPQKTDRTVEDIKSEFDNEIAGIVDAMTQRPSESKEEYAHRIIQTGIAIPVRLADNLHNFRTDYVFPPGKIKGRARICQEWLLDPARAEFGRYQLFRDVEQEVDSRLNDKSSFSDYVAAASFIGLLFRDQKQRK